MKEKILTILKQSRDYISGEVLSNKIGVSRTAVWKNINSLKKEGYVIESITKKGYKLVSCPDKILEMEIKEGLKTKYIGKKIYIYDSIDSTNTQGKREAIKGEKNGTIIIAEQQSQGKGRRGRKWISPGGEGLWFSCILRPNISTENASMITLIAGLAVCKSISEICDIEALIKWPNDIVVNKKKVCGILTEISTEIEVINYVILGIGVNVNSQEFSEDIKDIATSLRNETGNKINRIKLLKKIFEKFEYYYEKFLKTEDLSEIIMEYKNHCVNMNKQCKVIKGNHTIIGKVKDITDKGELIVKDEYGNCHIVSSGEISVRGLYGYV